MGMKSLRVCRPAWSVNWVRTSKGLLNNIIRDFVTEEIEGLALGLLDYK
jgi:hypothetical protein